MVKIPLKIEVCLGLVTQVKKIIILVHELQEHYHVILLI